MLRCMADKAPEPVPIPADAADQKLAGALIGYRRHDVDQFLVEVRETLRAVYAEKVSLTERIGRLEAELARRQELAPLLQSTLISTERAADTVRLRARAETDQLLDEAQARARRVDAVARAEAQQRGRETHHLLASLQSALAILETPPTESEKPEPELLVDALHDQIRRVSQ